MNNEFLPRHFHGTSDKDSEIFLQHFQIWILLQNYSERQAFNAFPLLLHDSANIWFEALDTNSKDNKQHIIERFKNYGIGRSISPCPNICRILKYETTRAPKP